MSSKASLAYKSPFFPQGRVLGGTSAINAMIYSRGVKHDYDSWGIPEWNWDSVYPYFLKNEGNQNFNNPQYHNTEGPSVVSSLPNTEVLKHAVLGAAQEAGFKVIDDMHGEEHNGFVLAQGTILNGERHSAANGYLNPAKDRPNLKVIKNAVVSSLIIAGKTVRGVNFELNGLKIRARARKEVIVSAGAFESPKLLQLSGIGRLEDLRPFKIRQIADLPVGYNLRDHVS